MQKFKFKGGVYMSNIAIWNLKENTFTRAQEYHTEVIEMFLEIFKRYVRSDNRLVWNNNDDTWQANALNKLMR